MHVLNGNLSETGNVQILCHPVVLGFTVLFPVVPFVWCRMYTVLKSLEGCLATSECILIPVVSERKRWWFSLLAVDSGVWSIRKLPLSVVSRANVLCFMLRNGNSARTVLQMLKSVFNTRIWYDGTVCFFVFFFFKRHCVFVEIIVVSRPHKAHWFFSSGDLTKLSCSYCLQRY